MAAGTALPGVLCNTAAVADVTAAMVAAYVAGLDGVGAWCDTYPPTRPGRVPYRRVGRPFPKHASQAIIRRLLNCAIPVDLEAANTMIQAFESKLPADVLANRLGNKPGVLRMLRVR